MIQYRSPHVNPAGRMMSATPTRRRLRKRRSAESAGSAPISSARSTSPRSRPLTTSEGRRSASRSARGRAPRELVFDRGGIETPCGEQDVRVEPEVRDLRDEPLVALPRPRESRLDTLLAHLARRRRGAFGDQVGDVRAFRPRRRALRDPAPEPGSEAGRRSRMTGRPGRTYAQQDRVAVAVVAELLHAERVARRLALPPELRT